MLHGTPPAAVVTCEQTGEYNHVFLLCGRNTSRNVYAYERLYHGLILTDRHSLRRKNIAGLKLQMKREL
jgi:hypothetical protein